MTIRGKTYKPRFISVLVFERFMHLMNRLTEEREQAKFDEYAATWLEVCSMMFEDDVSGLALDIITPLEMKEVSDFFTPRLSEATKGLVSGTEISPDSSNEAA